MHGVIPGSSHVTPESDDGSTGSDDVTRGSSDVTRLIHGATHGSNHAVKVPHIAKRLELAWRDVSRGTLEAIAVEGYREGALTRGQVERLLIVETSIASCSDDGRLEHLAPELSCPHRPSRDPPCSLRPCPDPGGRLARAPLASGTDAYTTTERSLCILPLV
jgi:hypothetical protein